jgi:hypothetical protein
MFIKVKVIPSSKVESITPKKEDSFEICVREDPIQGMASMRVIEILAEHLHLKKEKVRLIRGFKKRNKIFEILD